MKDMEILQIADQCGIVAITKHEWDGKRFNHTDDYLDGDGAALIIFAKLVAQHEREACAQVCEKFVHNFEDPSMVEHAAVVCAKSIRARGQA